MPKGAIFNALESLRFEVGYDSVVKELRGMCAEVTLWFRVKGREQM